MIRSLNRAMAALSLVSLGACGDDRGGETEHATTDDTTATTATTGTPESPTPGGPGTTTDSEQTTGVDTTTTDRRADDWLQQCLDQVKAGDVCGECACMHCLDELAVCEPDPNCKAIRECAHEVRCTGIDCLGPCGDVIDAHGGPFSPSSQLAQMIGVCVKRHCGGPC